MNSNVYRRNKIRTAWQIIQRIDNWSTALAMRLSPRKGGLRVLNFRSGPVVVCRSGAMDWTVIHELIFANSYSRAFDYLRKSPGSPLVIDCGANIGLFSLLAARCHPAAKIHAYEPGPPNYRIFEMNCLANPNVSHRIQIHKEAVGGETRHANWFFDEANPGSSSLHGANQGGCNVQIRSLAEIVRSLSVEVDLLKLDIEGAEFEVLANTPPETWKQIRAISLELHNDPAGKTTHEKFLDHMRWLGFQIELEPVCSLFLHR